MRKKSEKYILCFSSRFDSYGTTHESTSRNGIFFIVNIIAHNLSQFTTNCDKCTIGFFLYGFSSRKNEFLKYFS